MEELEMEEGWMQDFESAAEYYRPDFGDAKTPFKDITDFQKCDQSQSDYPPGSLALDDCNTN